MDGGFDEAWLAQYQAKRATPAAPARVPETISFVLPRAIPLLNQLLRMHWSKRRKYQQALSSEIARLIPHALGKPPISRATITITRYSVGTPDPDAITPKALLDCLLVRSKRHPAGLGILEDDDPARLTLKVSHAPAGKLTEQRTEVSIETLSRSAPP